MSYKDIVARRWVLKRLGIPTLIDKERRIVVGRYGIFTMVFHMTFWKNRAEVDVAIAGAWSRLSDIIQWSWIQERISEEDSYQTLQRINNVDADNKRQVINTAAGQDNRFRQASQRRREARVCKQPALVD